MDINVQTKTRSELLLAATLLETNINCHQFGDINSETLIFFVQMKSINETINGN